MKELKGMLETCGTDDGLPKDEMERERVRLEPLVEVFVEKSNEYLNMLMETEGDNDELIEDLNKHAENIDLNQQRLLAFKNKIDQEIEETGESDISPDKADLEVKKELSPTKLVVEVPATTSSAKVKLSKLTKVTKQSKADSGGLTVKPEMENLEGVIAEAPVSPPRYQYPTWLCRQC